MRVRVLMCAGLLAAGCSIAACGTRTEQGADPAAANPPAESCDAKQAEFAIGQQASGELLERARVAAAAETARFIRPDQSITTEYFGSRLNLSLDARDVVRGVSCG